MLLTAERTYPVGMKHYPVLLSVISLCDSSDVQGTFHHVSGSSLTFVEERDVNDVSGHEVRTRRDAVRSSESEPLWSFRHFEEVHAS